MDSSTAESSSVLVVLTSASIITNRRVRSLSPEASIVPLQRSVAARMAQQWQERKGAHFMAQQSHFRYFPQDYFCVVYHCSSAKLFLVLSYSAVVVAVVGASSIGTIEGLASTITVRVEVAVRPFWSVAT